MNKNIDLKIKSIIKKKLNPPIHEVALKVLTVHLISAIITLSICPQFGKKLFNLDIDLMEVFMHMVGSRYCVILCGAFFIASSFLLNAIILNYDELRIIRTHRHLTIFVIVLISFGSFLMFDPVLFLESTALWFIGAILGGYIALEFANLLKRKIALIN